MFYDIDVYTSPDLVPALKEEIAKLQDDIAVVEGFIHARNRLGQMPRLGSDTLSKCDVLITYIDSAPPDDNLCMQLRCLSFDELAFSSICFSERQLKRVRDALKAPLVQTFMRAQHISCLGRLEIFRRLSNVLAKTNGTRFRDIFLAAQARNAVPMILPPNMVHMDTAAVCQVIEPSSSNHSSWEESSGDDATRFSSPATAGVISLPLPPSAPHHVSPASEGAYSIDSYLGTLQFLGPDLTKMAASGFGTTNTDAGMDVTDLMPNFHDRIRQASQSDPQYQIPAYPPSMNWPPP